jgi:hypothetical protein
MPTPVITTSLSDFIVCHPLQPAPSKRSRLSNSGREQPLHALRNKARDADWQW